MCVCVCVCNDASYYRVPATQATAYVPQPVSHCSYAGISIRAENIEEGGRGRGSAWSQLLENSDGQSLTCNLINGRYSIQMKYEVMH